MKRAAKHRLNRALVLSALDQTADGAGGYHEVWQDLGTLWADVRARSGRIAAQSGTATSLQHYRITVRAAPVGAPDRPQAGHRLRDGARVFLIHAVAEEDADGRFLTCFATEEIAI
ncbi:head-tail adaptor [Epibacterium ulvae]|uniref:Head-tail adaptor n=1 Tax=Epibacterium ulvae TaxID=1156985 RepID=A0A1G5RC78_9RHOB|nr:head-tail adaptor protein [Epibacterium ulvae]SCZ71647.1 head-tail adaptor [Epibacterium ulvae]